ncbi:MAG TPA: histidine kinase [Burkholderiaceae bacterium]|nr:histidine kinase [Burkholderiaceae bacterium]
MQEKSPPPGLRARYFRWAQAYYDRLPALAREDARRFDEWFYSLSGVLVMASLVALAGLLAWALVAGRPDKSWWLVFGLMLLLVFALAFAGMSMWFAHGRKSSRPWRVVFLASSGAILGGYVGYLSGRVGKQGLDLAHLQEAAERVTPIIAPIALGIGGALALISLLRNREYAARARAGELQAEAERAQRLASEAELRALQAQIEPHFLFNSLSTAQYLAEAGDPRAGPLLAELNGLLRNTLEATRARDVAVADEAQRVRHYLAICALRLGPRLGWSITLDPQTAAARIPPAALLTLVENAVEHGIEPALAGGRIEIEGRATLQGLEIEVRNTGLAPATMPAAGIGLINLRERLRLLAGPSARLTLLRDGEWTRARIELPLTSPA